ncbi:MULTISPECIES: efflux RND transporter periplasmic adaptor subunit [Methylosinus]|nr:MULTISPECIES: efflux RND transporter periplasmic adaptor subunit [Methylosinus]
MTMSANVDEKQPEGAVRRRAQRAGIARPPRLSRLVFLSLVLATGGGLALYLETPRAQAPAAIDATLPTVTVSAPLRRRLAPWTDFLGQFSAVDRVEIRAQVGGYLKEIHFNDGQLVEKGDLLFVIDARPYEIQLQQANAQRRIALAQLELAKKELERSSALSERNYVSRETHDQRVQQKQAAEAALQQAEAAVHSGELNLEWTRIRSPISGRVSTRRVSPGNLVVGGQSGGATTLLTTVVSLDPIYLDFDMSESDYVAYQRHLHSDSGPDRIVRIALSDEEEWTRRGRLDFLDNELDRASGVIHARISVPNADSFIAPGQFARLRVPTAAEADTLLVPEAALRADQSHTLLMTVSADGTVVPKDVEVGASIEGMRIVKRGIGPADRVIINGLIFARPGAKVTAQSGRMAEAVGRN